MLFTEKNSQIFKLKVHLSIGYIVTVLNFLKIKNIAL